MDRLQPAGFQPSFRISNRVTAALTPPLDVPPLMAELVAWLNAPTEIHPVLTSGIAQFQLVHIHPFVDGNGRTSRLLSMLCLYRATQMDEVRERGQRIIRRDVIARTHGLNQRQALAVGYLLENPELRIEDFELLCPKVNRRTLQRDLRGMLENGVLKAKGAARAVEYALKVKGL